MKLFLLFLSVSAQAANPALELLKASDRARGSIGTGITWEVKVTTTEEGETSDRTFLVKARGDDAVAEALEPARTKGEIFLINNRNMWFFKPSLRKPVAISSRQKLSGQAANGDIASTNYARDYTGTIVGEETVQKQKAKVLMLKAKSKDVTYDQIKYWISVKDKQALKAEFQTLQGVPFKVADFFYKNQIVLKGKKVPFVSQMVITDAKFPQNKSILDYQKPRAENHSPSSFNVNNLVR